MKGKNSNVRKICVKQLVQASALLLLVMPYLSYAAGWQMIPPQRVASLMKEGSGMWLVDVRTPLAFEEMHIEGAMNIPAAVIPAKSFPRQKMIVLVDESLGLKNARMAADQLARSGQEKVYVLDGGMHVWQAEGYPLAGKRGGRKFPMVTPEELAWARENRVALRIYDLRDKDERDRSPIRDATPLAGTNLTERLEKMKGLLMPQKKALAGKLEKPATMILILPLASEAKEVAARVLYDLSVDVRCLDGGYAAWMAKPESKVVTDASCPVCPGGKGERGKK